MRRWNVSDPETQYAIICWVIDMPDSFYSRQLNLKMERSFDFVNERHNIRILIPKKLRVLLSFIGSRSHGSVTFVTLVSVSTKYYIKWLLSGKGFPGSHSPLSGLELT